MKFFAASALALGLLLSAGSGYWVGYQHAWHDQWKASNAETYIREIRRVERERDELLKRIESR
jgi:hypothetical protein